MRRSGGLPRLFFFRVFIAALLAEIVTLGAATALLPMAIGPILVLCLIGVIAAFAVASVAAVLARRWIATPLGQIAGELTAARRFIATINDCGMLCGGRTGLPSLVLRRPKSITTFAT
jgi:hypothetical protein